jgi:Lon protease-like protein
MADPAHSIGDLSAIPLFPLPNVVLFPRAVLPLHIFEERYKAMTANALRGRGLIAMALLKSGWEKNYYQRPAIEPVVCVGTILSHEKLPDGKYNFLLQGRVRARVVREIEQEQPYRVAELAPLQENRAMEMELAEERRRLISDFDGGTLLATGIGRQFRQLLSTPLSTADIADLIAFNFLDDVKLKQSLLAECDVRARVAEIVRAFERNHPALQPVTTSSRNPSMN